MTLYSLNGGLPAPLPHRIRVPDGAGRMRTRTDPATFTPAELAAAGYVLADARPEPVGGIAARWDGAAWVSAPSFDPASQHPPVWTGAAWSDPADLTLAEIAVAKRAASRDAFRAARDAGTLAEVAEGVELAIATTHEAAVELREAVADIGVNGPMPAVTRADVPVQFTEPAASAALEAIRARVRACCQAEYDIAVAITAALAAEDRAALLAIDPTSGYPAPPA